MVSARMPTPRFFGLANSGFHTWLTNGGQVVGATDADASLLVKGIDEAVRAELAASDAGIDDITDYRRLRSKRISILKLVTTSFQATLPAV